MHDYLKDGYVFKDGQNKLVRELSTHVEHSVSLYKYIFDCQDKFCRIQTIHLLFVNITLYSYNSLDSIEQHSKTNTTELIQNSSKGQKDIYIYIQTGN